ncbi:MAG: hypothetical protein ACIAQZ_00105 [Sedimentisphaeraceae bacterium JB056]
MIKKTVSALLILFTNFTLAYNGAESETFSGPYSTAMENFNPLASDAAIAGFIGSSGRGICNPGVNDEEPSGDTTSNYINPVFKNWASNYANYIPAPAMDQSLIGNEVYSPTGGVPDIWRKPQEALGHVTGDNFNVCVLGDLWLEQLAVLNPENSGYMYNYLLADDDPNKIQPGQITLSFDEPITNGPGPDFAVFENGFISAGGAGVGGQIFAELAYVEVSTNGIDFVRFPSVSLTPDDVGAYGTIDPSNVYNLAGKHVNAYESSWGTPFNLKDIETFEQVITGTVDINNINYVRIIDIPGNGFFQDNASTIIEPNSIDESTGTGGTLYEKNHGIHDAWVTWGSGGFDLEAIGAIQQIYGDANSDGIVDMMDFIRLASRWKQYGNWPQGDFNEDRYVDEHDMFLLAENWLYDLLNE